MSRTIYKYELEATDTQTITMSEHAKILSVQTIKGKIYLWALVDTSKKGYTCTIHTFGTGHPIDSALNLDYIGTVQLYDGDMIVHVFKGI